jgi:hypothetical protein
MHKPTLSIDQARRIVLAAQQLTGRSAQGKDGALGVIQDLGYVQIDTISVVARAHHLTLWNRCPGYRPPNLHDLLTRDRSVFEYWAHAIAYLPISDYRFYIPRMLRHRSGTGSWLADWERKNPHVLEDVLARVRAEGALTSKDFELPPGAKRGTWWDWKPAKRALEILFWQGHLMISARRNFQKVYDLTERVLPPETDTTVPSHEELARFHIRRALGGMGLAQEIEIRDAFHVANRETLAGALEALCGSGEVTQVSIAGIDGVYFSLTKTLERVDIPSPQGVFILSPFDNLVIQRDRLERLFGFQYTIECYLPAAKRTYGYFVLPILWRDRMIGRMDAKADRKAKTLQVKKLWFEDRFGAIGEALPVLSDALARFAAFHRCQEIEVGPVVPTGHKRLLNSLVKRSLREHS